MANTRKTQAEVIEALQKTGGIITEAAKLLGLASTDSLRRRVVNTPALHEACDEIREQTKDLAEGNIIKALKDGDKQTSQWYLNSLGRDRGYGNKTEIALNGKLLVTPDVDLSRLSMEELKKLEEIASKVTGNPSTD